MRKGRKAPETEEAALELLTSMLAEVLGTSAGEIPPETTLPELGLASVQIARVINLVGRAVPVVGLMHQHDMLSKPQRRLDLEQAERSGEHPLRQEEQEHPRRRDALLHRLPGHDDGVPTRLLLQDCRCSVRRNRVQSHPPP